MRALRAERDSSFISRRESASSCGADSRRLAATSVVERLQHRGADVYRDAAAASVARWPARMLGSA